MQIKLDFCALNHSVRFHFSELLFRWDEKYGKRKKVYDSCNRVLALGRRVQDHKTVRFSEIEREWHAAFTAILKMYGWNKKAIEHFWDNLDCNWEHLWMTDEEKNRTSAAWSEHFFGEVGYCIDRLTFCRVLRTHWIFLQYKRSWKAERKVA